MTTPEQPDPDYNSEPDAPEAEVAAAAEPVEPEPEVDVDSLLAERTDDLQRVSAEYANYRKRAAAGRQAMIDQAKANVVLKFLPVFDDLDLAAQHGDLEAGPLKAVSDKLHGVLGELNVTPFGAPGDEFNPEIHEAVQDLSSGDEKHIGVVLRQGYTIGERLLRTAMVIIDDAPADTATDGTPADGSEDNKE